MERWQLRQCRHVAWAEQRPFIAKLPCFQHSIFLLHFFLVQLVADLVRRLECIAPPASLDCLLSLRFPDIVGPISCSGMARQGHNTEHAIVEHQCFLFMGIWAFVNQADLVHAASSLGRLFETADGYSKNKLKRSRDGVDRSFLEAQARFGGNFMLRRFECFV